MLVVSIIHGEALMVPQSHEDGSGGLSRSGLNLEAERARRYEAHLSFLLMDVDGLSLVNESIGREAADRLLVEVADLIRSKIRKIDIFGRWTPEDFALLTVDRNASGSVTLAEKLRRAVANTRFRAAEREVRLTISIGVARGVPADEEGLDTLIEAARRALVKAKASGRNRVEFMPGPKDPHCLPARTRPAEDS